MNCNRTEFAPPWVAAWLQPCWRWPSAGIYLYINVYVSILSECAFSPFLTRTLFRIQRQYIAYLKLHYPALWEVTSKIQESVPPAALGFANQMLTRLHAKKKQHPSTCTDNGQQRFSVPPWIESRLTDKMRANPAHKLPLIITAGMFLDMGQRAEEREYAQYIVLYVGVLLNYDGESRCLCQ